MRHAVSGGGRVGAAFVSAWPRTGATASSTWCTSPCRRAAPVAALAMPCRCLASRALLHAPSPPPVYAVWEMRALLKSATREATARQPMLATDALRRLPNAAQTQLQQYVSSLPTSPSGGPAKSGAGFLAYVRDHLSDSFAIQSACLVPLDGQPSDQKTPPPTAAPAPRTSSGFANGAGSGFRAASAAAFANALPPPPSPREPVNREEGASAPADGAPRDSAAANVTPKNNTEAMSALVPYLPTFYVPADRVAASLPPALQQLYCGSTFLFYLRRFRYYVDIRIARGGIAEVRLRPGFSHPEAGAADARFQGAFASLASARSPGTATVDRAVADDRTTSLDDTASAHDDAFSSSSATSARPARTGRGFAQTVQDGSAFRPPPRHSEAHLIALVLPHIPKEFTALAEVLPEVSDMVSHHASFNSLLGVTGFFCKYPEYFQLAYARIRVRPYRSAPNALDDLDLTSSPFPEVMAKVWARCEAAAVGKNYDDPVERKEATVNTSKLYALLTSAEKEAVRSQCGSFPQFLRLHGQLLLISPDNMRACVFKPEFEKCAETILDVRLQYGLGGVAGGDPAARIPERMPDGSTATNAVREVYDALPLTQCVPLDDLLLLVPTHVSAALPSTVDDVAALLEQHPDSFRVWRFPDDPSVVVVMRAQVDVPDLDHAELLRAVLALIPAQGGGTDMQTMLQRAPAHVQRYLYQHGVRATLEKLHSQVAVSGDRVIRFQREQ